MAGAGLRGDVVRRLAGVSALGVAALAFVATPWIPALCPTRLLFHVPCPSCGLTRAGRAVLHGDLALAMQLHPLWWAILPFFLGVLGVDAYEYVRTGRAGRLTSHPAVQRLGVLLCVLLVAVWIARGFGAFGGPVPLD